MARDHMSDKMHKNPIRVPANGQAVIGPALVRMTARFK